MANLLTDSETARILRLTSRQVARMAKQGKLPCVLLPGDEVRFDPDDIRKWVESLKMTGAAEKFAKRLTEDRS